VKTWGEVGIEIPAGATGEVYTTCPKCSHERKKKNAKCLSANVAEGVWICHHCGWAGSLTERQDTNHEPPWRKPRWRPAPRREPIAKLPDNVIAWFAERGIPENVLARNRVDFGKVYMPQLEEEVDAVIFPYFRGGKLVNRKYRDGRKNFRQDAGAERILYGLDDIGEALVWVEGEVDKLSLEVAGYTSCVSVPDGAPAEGTKDYSSKFAFLDSAEALLSKVKRHVIAVDNDGPGKLLEDELARRLGREKCWRVEWPEGKKDANEVLVRFGAEGIRWAIEHADPFPIEGVFTTLGESSKVYALYRHGFERGHETGWKSVDRHYTVRAGEFTVVTGIPGHGKSNWLDALMVNLAKLHGWSFALFSPENQPLEDHIARMIEKWIGMPFSPGPTPRMSEADVQRGLEWADRHFAWILPNNEHQWEIDWILERARELVFRRGIRGLVIDPWNELEPQRKHGETETDYVSRVLRATRQFARQHGIHVWMVVHPAKLQRQESGRYPVPTLYDCAGSAHWRNKADNGICIWRDLSDPDTRAVRVYIQKIRFRQIGRLGDVTLYYDLPTGLYRETQEQPEDAAQERFL
jgi:twinkle protein